MKLSTEKEKEAMREWYQKNREYHIANVQARQKANGYSTEKTKMQRKTRYIKRRTRYLYPLEDHRCEFCPLLATERHHPTSPPQIHKFNFVCHDCHMEKDLAMENHSKIQLTKYARKSEKGGK